MLLPSNSEKKSTEIEINFLPQWDPNSQMTEL